MFSPNTLNVYYEDYIYNTSTSGMEIYNEEGSLVKYVTYSGGLNSVWANDDYAYIATPDDGIYRLDIDYITSISGMDLTSYISVFKQYPDITDNDVKYIHGCGDYLCVVTALGVDHFNLGLSHSYSRSSGLTAAAEKCFQTCRGRFYYTTQNKIVTIYTHQCDWTPATVGYEYDSTASGTLLPVGSQINDIHVVERNRNLIFAATSSGIALIEERPGNESNANYKHYFVEE